MFFWFGAGREEDPTIGTLGIYKNGTLILKKNIASSPLRKWQSFTFSLIPHLLSTGFPLCGCLSKYSKLNLQSVDHEILKLCHSGRVPRGPWEVTRLRKSARCQSCLFMAELSLPGLTHLHSHPLPNCSGEEKVQEGEALVLVIRRQLVVGDGFFQPLLPTVGEHRSGKDLGRILPSSKGAAVVIPRTRPQAQRGLRSSGLGSRRSGF